jgi:hypothetical protein
VSVNVTPIDPWDKAAILAKLDAVVPLLYDAAEAATHQARSFFDSLPAREAERRDPYLFAHLVRFYVCRALDERGQTTDFDKDWLANSGVSFRLDWLAVRFLKSAMGQLPAPGKSMTKRRFYRQIIGATLWEIDSTTRSIPSVNVVITWDVDSLGNLSRLNVYCPSDGADSLDSVHWYWREELAHPATTIEPPPSETPSEDDDREDLDIGDVELEEAEEEPGSSDAG